LTLLLINMWLIQFKCLMWLVYTCNVIVWYGYYIHSIWKFDTVSTNVKYVINRLMHVFFHFRTVIIPRPISTLGLKPTGRYRSLGMITVLIWKRNYTRYTPIVWHWFAISAFLRVSCWERQYKHCAQNFVQSSHGNSENVKVWYD
jgi:hypothetical protein